MSHELFNQLEQKITSAVDALEMLKMETEELREENTRLKQEREEWERRLNSLLGKFEELGTSDSPSGTNIQSNIQDSTQGNTQRGTY